MMNFYVLFIGICGALILLLLIIRVYKVVVDWQRGIRTSDILGIIIAIMTLGLVLSQIGLHWGYIESTQSRSLAMFFVLSLMSSIYAYLRLSKSVTG